MFFTIITIIIRTILQYIVTRNVTDPSTLLYFPNRLLPLESIDYYYYSFKTSTINSQKNPRDSQKYLICGLVI